MTEIMSLKEKYYLNGYLYRKFKMNDDLKDVLNIIDGIHKDGPKEGFHLKEKYANSKDIRPGIYKYDNAFINLLISNNISELLKEITGKELYLAHIQLRISYPGKSYMEWHRDTHIYKNKIVGNIPPANKIIFYPKLNSKSCPKIRLIPGSQRKMFGNQLVDRISARFSKSKTINSSDSKFMVFDTALLHHVVPEIQENGSWRLIYMFLQKDQLENYDKNLIQLYKTELNSRQ